MSDNSGVYSIAITLLILNIVTPIFVFALTEITTSQDFSNEIDYLSEEDLISAGVYLQSDERYLLTYQGSPDYVEFINTSKVLRVRWFDPGLAPSRFEIYTKLFGQLNNYWLFAHLEKTIVSGETYQEGTPPNIDYLTNQTILNAWSNQYNWTRASVPPLGVELFFTCEKYSNNITLALDSGELNVTAGTTLDYSNFTPLNFISWYWGQLSGAEYYDMPVYIAWIFRLQAVMLIFSGVIIARDLIGFT
jgi:hypothetical protein